MADESLVLIIADKNYSSWSMRPWLALRASGLPFLEKKIFLDFPDTRQAILKHSPSGKVPALHHGATRVWDSLAICEYVAEISPNRLWPEASKQRAHARSIVAEMHSGFASLRQQLSMDIRLQTQVGHLLPGTVSDIKRILDMWAECLDVYEGPFLFGRHFSIADAFYVPVVLRFRSYGISIGDKGIQKYMHHMTEFQPVADWIQEATAEKNAEFQF